jgi:hypothetical protein
VVLKGGLSSGSPTSVFKRGRPYVRCGQLVLVQGGFIAIGAAPSTGDGEVLRSGHAPFLGSTIFCPGWCRESTVALDGQGPKSARGLTATIPILDRRSSAMVFPRRLLNATAAKTVLQPLYHINDFKLPRLDD